MPPPYSVSRCSLGSPVMFRWYGDTPVESGNHLRAATESFLRVINSPTRDLGTFSQESLVAEFQDRLLEAMRGKLSGTKRIKTIALFPRIPLFEIRWSAMTLIERDTSGERVTRRLAIRLYHSEPRELEGCFVGHVIHEKLSESDPDPRAAQNERISDAADLYRIGRHTLWNTVDTSRPPI